MRRSLLLATSTLVSALVLSCGEQQSPTAPIAGASGGRSASVIRGTLPIGFFFTDEKRGLTTQIGNPFAELPVLCAGGQAPPPASRFLEVDKPSGDVKFQVRNKQLYVQVWQLVSTDFCGVLATTTPYAEGTARLNLEDNHANPFPIERGANASSLRAEGTVTVLATGEELRYRAIFFLVLPRGSTSLEDAHLLRAEILLR
jgi:hypothetical protein